MFAAPKDGPIVIDNSSAWRMDPDVPLVVPEINMATCKGKKLIANPNCTTSIALMALAPLHKAFGIKKCIISTYQVCVAPRKGRVCHAPLSTTKLLVHHAWKRTLSEYRLLQYARYNNDFQAVLRFHHLEDVVA